MAEQPSRIQCPTCSTVNDVSLLDSGCTGCGSSLAADATAIMARAREIAHEQGSTSGAWEAARAELHPKLLGAGSNRPSLPWWLITPGALFISSIVLTIAVLADDTDGDELQAMRNVAWLLVILPLIFLVFMPWFGVSLIDYAKRLENRRPRTTVRVVGIALIAIAAAPWVVWFMVRLSLLP